MKRFIPYLKLTVCLIIGNFIWAALWDHSWSVAFERSYFQTAALMIAAWRFA